MGRIGRKVRIREVISQLVIEESLMEFVFAVFDFVFFARSWPRLHAQNMQSLIRTISMAVAMKTGVIHSLVITPLPPLYKCLPNMMSNLRVLISKSPNTAHASE
jgi:hypothetical protein